MVNKLYAFKFENLSIFIAFPLPSIEMGAKFHVFQSDLVNLTCDSCIPMQNLKKNSVIVIDVFFTLISAKNKRNPQNTNTFHLP